MSLPRPRSLRRSLCLAVTTGLVASVALVAPAALAQDGDAPPPTAPETKRRGPPSRRGSPTTTAGPPAATTTTAAPAAVPTDAPRSSADPAPAPDPSPETAAPVPTAPPAPPTGVPDTANPPSGDAAPMPEPVQDGGVVGTTVVDAPAAAPGAPAVPAAATEVVSTAGSPVAPAAAPGAPAVPAVATEVVTAAGSPVASGAESGVLVGNGDPTQLPYTVPRDQSSRVLAASVYDGIYADGLPIGVAMATSRLLESGNNYSAQAAGASASGAYQIIDMFWNNYGGYPRALLAPQEVQDQFAYEQFVAILKRSGNNLAAIPVAWYYPIALTHPELMDTVPRPDAGNRLTIREYQQLWLATFFELLGQGAPPFLPKESDPLIPSIAFPVLGPVNFWHDFGAPRGKHGERSHEGLDMIGYTGQPLRAAFDGTITRIQVDPRGISGVVVTVTRSDGIRANYFHVNDDTPGTTDGSAERGLRIHPGLRLGDSVKGGQVIAYMGDTGNAGGLPHLHFELRAPDGIPIDPFPAVLAAQQREQCSVGIGPWSTDFVSPQEQAQFLTEFAALPVEEQDLMKWAAASTEPPPVHTIVVGPDGARWEIDAGGTVRASGEAALIQPGSGECEQVPDRSVLYGTGAAGISRELLPVDWWDVGVAYAGAVAGDDLSHGDGIVAAPIPHRVAIRRS